MLLLINGIINYMSAKGYTTKTKIENYILQNIDSSFDTQIDNWIAGIEKTIDKYTGRNFIADTVASARVYDSDGETPTLLIDDCISVSKVEVGDDAYGSAFTEIESSGSDRYFLEPNNYLSKGYPISRIVLASRLWTAGKQNNRITAKWGYSESVPKDIEFACTVFVAGIINQSIPGGDQIKSEKIGNYQVTYNSEDGNNSFADFKNAMSILDSYKNLEI